VESLSRRSFLRTAALGSAGLVIGSKIKAQPARLPRKPNLIVFLPDQQRADTISCYGARRISAPNLDKLASQSCVFERAYVTHPVCTPSRSSLMTGTWPHVNGCTHNNLILPHDFRCLPEMIGDTDYRTAYMGKWHLGDEKSAQHGFERWISISQGGEEQSDDHVGEAITDYHNFLVSKGLKPDDKVNGGFTRNFVTKLPLALSKPKFLEGKACDFLEQQGREPFILFVAFFEPHPPYSGPLNDMHVLDKSDLDPTRDDSFGQQMPLRYRLRQECDRHRFRNAEKQLRVKRNYLGLVTEVDQTIGVILTKLEKLGLADNTIVVHTSDHGDMMGAHGLFGKEVSFEEAVRVPYLVRLPGQSRTAPILQPVSHIDFVPTLLDLFGKPPHPQCAGKSRAPLLRGESMAPETVFVEWSPNKVHRFLKGTRLAKTRQIMRAFRESTRVAISPDGWKICLRDHDNNELYSLQSDPSEKQNLYDYTERKDVISRLTGDIHRWQESVSDKIKV
jgi:arylsulfatase A-like enzyme